MKSVIAPLKELLGSVRVNSLSNARVLACSSKVDYCIRVTDADLQRMRDVIFSNRRILDESGSLTEESVFVLNRVIKLHGKHSFDVALSKKLRALSDILKVFQKSKSRNSRIVSSVVNECIFDILPLSKTLGGIYHHPNKSFSQEIETAVHNADMEKVGDQLLSWDQEMNASGILLENSSNIPGHEILLSRNGNPDKHLPRRLLRKLVVKLTFNQHNDLLPIVRQYLKMISPLDDVIATASGHALSGNVEQILQVVKDEESVFVDQPTYKVCFDVSVALELFENGFEQRAFSFLDNQNESSRPNRIQLDSNSAIIVDSVVTYCIMNRLDGLASKLMKTYCLSPWENSILYPTVMSKRKDYPNHNYNLFARTYRLPAVSLKKPIKPTEPFKHSNMRIFKLLNV